MGTVHRFPASNELESALDLGERRFLPVIERLEGARLEAESGKANAEASFNKVEMHRVKTRRSVDLFGRSASVCGLVAAAAAIADTVVGEPIFSAVMTVLFLASAALCLSALARANAGLRGEIVKGTRAA